MKRNKIPNVIRGGIAVPLGRNYYYMRGRKHEQGGIDIGKNPRTGLEVEDGEVMYVGNKDIKIFSSLPFLNGKSPAQRVMSGENPNAVFNAQESFKRRNKINDDGTKKKSTGGQIPRRRYITRLTPTEEKEFQTWYSKIAKYKNLNPNPDANGQDYDYRGYWRNEDRIGILGSNPNAHFTDKYKQPSHPTFSNESIYSSPQTPGGTWVKGKGTWLFKHNKFTARQADRTTDYLNGTGEGFILGTDTIIPNIRKRMGGLSRSKDYGSKSKPYPKVKKSDFAGGGRSYPIPTKADARDALRLAGLHHRPDVKAKVYRKYPELKKKAKAGGLYSLTVNGETTLHQFPSTGEIKQSVTANDVERSTMKYGGRKRMRAGGDETQAERARKYAEKFRNSIPNFAPAVRNYKFDDPANHPPFQLTVPNTKTNNNRPAANVMLPEITVTSRRRNTTNIRRTNITPTNNRRTASNSIRNNIPANIQFRSDNRIGDFETVDKSPVNRQNNSRTVSINRITPVSIANSESPSLIVSIPNRQYQANDRLNTLRKITPAPIAGSISAPTLNVTAPNVFADTNTNTIIGTRSNSKFRDFLRNNVDNIADGLGLLTNIGLSIVGRNINNRMLNSLRYTNAPIPQRAAKLKTRININPQLDRMRESLASYERNIDANTGSSQIALGRKQKARLADVLGRNELYADKENKETELINTDRINQQEVANKNIEAYNNWVAGKAAFENSIAEQKASNRIAAINNINAGVQQIVSNIQQRMADQRTLAALTLGSPNLPAEMFYGSGIWNKRMYDLYRRSYPLKRK